MPRYPFTEQMDGELRAAYDKMRRFGNRAAIPALREKWGYPKHVLNKRGRELGLARCKEKPWSAQEIALLKANRQLSLSVLARKFRTAGWPRTETAINLKLKRLGVRSEGKQHWSLTAIARALGIDQHKVREWVSRKWLVADQRQSKRTEQQGGDTYLVHQADLRRFLLHHPEEYELAAIVDKFWFLHMVSGGQLKREYRDELWADSWIEQMAAEGCGLAKVEELDEEAMGPAAQDSEKGRPRRRVRNFEEFMERKRRQGERLVRLRAGVYVRGANT